MVDKPTVHVTPASDTPFRRPPWPHWPHCPDCHARVVSYDPEATMRWSGRYVYDARTFTGTECHECGANLGRPAA